jgi:5-(carboxyamino)imidazole ribonucleotide synthase
MLALAGYPLGLRFRFLDPSPGSPAGQIAEHIVAEYTDAHALRTFAAGLDVITYEFENVPVDSARTLVQHALVYPPPEALEASQDRLNEKTLFRRLGIPTPPFAPVNTREELDEAIHNVGYPAVLKTRRLGYDGKGQMVIRDAAEAEAAWQGLSGAPLILESLIEFEREASLLAVRGRDGQIAIYPPIENHHRDGLLRLSLAPALDFPPLFHSLAEAYVKRVLTALNYVGVLAIEFFLTGDRLYANEMAPRVHNSGHWTIEGAETSQFENHLRAGLGWPLGSTAPRGYSAMLNLIGEAPPVGGLLKLENAHVHLYGKAPRPGRKLGHLTLRADSAEQLAVQLNEARQIIGL